MNVIEGVVTTIYGSCLFCFRQLFSGDKFTSYQINVFPDRRVEFTERDYKQPTSGVVRCICSECLLLLVEASSEGQPPPQV